MLPIRKYLAEEHLPDQGWMDSGEPSGIPGYLELTKRFGIKLVKASVKIDFEHLSERKSSLKDLTTLMASQEKQFRHAELHSELVSRHFQQIVKVIGNYCQPCI